MCAAQLRANQAAAGTAERSMLQSVTGTPGINQGDFRLHMQLTVRTCILQACHRLQPDMPVHAILQPGTRACTDTAGTHLSAAMWQSYGPSATRRFGLEPDECFDQRCLPEASAATGPPAAISRSLPAAVNGCAGCRCTTTRQGSLSAAACERIGLYCVACCR